MGHLPFLGLATVSCHLHELESGTDLCVVPGCRGCRAAPGHVGWVDAASAQGLEWVRTDFQGSCCKY